jgi:glycosyltransferase involved in cell wall biosynthesis
MPQVARTFPSARLIIVGDGFLRGEVENEIDAAKARDLVVLVGKREDPGPFISISDIFAHISLRDTFGQVLLEALSLGKPVFVNEETAYNLPPEIRDGAIMVVGTTVPEIAQGLTTISSDVGLRSRLAQKGQSIVTAAYEWDNIARRMMKIYGIPTDGISASSGL